MDNFALVTAHSHEGRKSKDKIHIYNEKRDSYAIDGLLGGAFLKQRYLNALIC